MAERPTRNYKAIVSDIAEGFVVINPLYLKGFDEDSLKRLNEAIERRQAEVRKDPLPPNDVAAIRNRNMKLQRLYTSLTILKNYAREKRFSLVEKKHPLKKKIAYF
ncbi:MAG: hypothetical protein EPN22_16510 [Nitrospirae bacterium]|nr:MAG: hypothetical protein EPN22_16510 [Nitrospirota bacterium]